MSLLLGWAKHLAWCARWRQWLIERCCICHRFIVTEAHFVCEEQHYHEVCFDAERRIMRRQYERVRTFRCREHGDFTYDGPDFPLCAGCVVPYMPETSPLQQAAEVRGGT